jgi:hypothetical protein
MAFFFPQASSARHLKIVAAYHPDQVAVEFRLEWYLANIKHTGFTVT